MSFRDRFYTPTTAKAILSWRIALGLGVAVVAGLLGAPIVLAVVGGAAVYAGSVYLAMPRGSSTPRMDPFTLGEPWRQLVQSAQRAGERLHRTVDQVDPGPLRDRLAGISEQLDRALADCWRIAQRGDQLDDTVRQLDPTALRSKLATLEQRAAGDPSPEHEAAVESVRRQLETSDRVKERSARTAAHLRLTQTRLDELVARAAEVSLGAADTDAYEHDVDDLVVELEAMRLAMEETQGP
jgi:hypothetical protein